MAGSAGQVGPNQASHAARAAARVTGSETACCNKVAASLCPPRPAACLPSDTRCSFVYFLTTTATTTWSHVVTRPSSSPPCRDAALRLIESNQPPGDLQNPMWRENQAVQRAWCLAKSGVKVGSTEASSVVSPARHLQPTPSRPCSGSPGHVEESDGHDVMLCTLYLRSLHGVSPTEQQTGQRRACSIQGAPARISMATPPAPSASHPTKLPRLWLFKVAGGASKPDLQPLACVQSCHPARTVLSASCLQHSHTSPRCQTTMRHFPRLCDEQPDPASS